MIFVKSNAMIKSYHLAQLPSSEANKRNPDTGSVQPEWPQRFNRVATGVSYATVSVRAYFLLSYAYQTSISRPHATYYFTQLFALPEMAFASRIPPAFWTHYQQDTLCSVVVPKSGVFGECCYKRDQQQLPSRHP